MEISSILPPSRPKPLLGKPKEFKALPISDKLHSLFNWKSNPSPEPPPRCKQDFILEGQLKGPNRTSNRDPKAAFPLGKP
jgi:hypothetical protein